ncbi:hypothetical protein PMPD1_2663 [Paramixta manurensis]|uniref:Morphogenetic protein n=1 Tax=Paramixta manurensis TaxID=2740817 RepID=A0A6M8UR60_9GAMM|nr:hypothetical protein PMPD1_2663 [Erwiniaceae bacterium PD-1]
MKERPILFSDQRVRALLIGQQTQTRRIMKSQAFGPGQDNHEGCYVVDVLSNHQQGRNMMSMADLSYQCPFGQPGDQLWVRETWRGPIIPPEHVNEYQHSPAAFRQAQYCQYRADNNEFSRSQDGDYDSFGWQTGIHMPRWASRINLLITDVRAERIQDISDDDVLAEGVQTDSHFLNNFFTLNSESIAPKEAYKKAWEKQYGGTSWEVNPWVWVIEFRRV